MPSLSRHLVHRGPAATRSFAPLRMTMMRGRDGLARHGDAVALVQGIEAAPTVDGQELVVGGGADRPAKARREAEDRLDAGRKGSQDLPAIEPPRERIDRQHVEPGLTDESGDR